MSSFILEYNALTINDVNYTKFLSSILTSWFSLGYKSSFMTFARFYFKTDEIINAFMNCERG